MKENKAEIKIGTGWGLLQFGMRPDQVRALLGEPDEIERYSLSEEGEDEDLTEDWHYDALELSLSFDEVNEWSLSTLATTDPEVTLRGKKLIGLNYQELLTQIEALELGSIDLDEDSSEGGLKQRLVGVEDSNIFFFLEDGIVQDIQWSALFPEDEF
ncbi:MAG: hypothetical protein HC880_01005 [Bacteroidia bacterium]|nr:hypothetical protein [Bacteroidia bacterium]